MKTRKQSIDELFREGLDSFQQKPSGMLWWRISWKLLKNEVSHLDFTNLITLRTTIPVSLVIAGLLAVYYYDPFSGVPENETSNKSTSPDNHLETIIDPSQSRDTSLYSQNDFKEILSEKTNNQETSTDTDSSLPIQKEVIQDSPASIKKNNYDFKSSNYLNITEQSSYNPLTSDFGVQQNEAKNIEKHDIISQDQRLEKGTLTPETATSFEKISNTESEIALQPLPVISLFPSFNLSPSREHNIPVHPKISSDQAVLQDLEMDHESGKPISLNSLNYSLIYLFKGEYKPPRRDFQTNQFYSQTRKRSWIDLSLYVSPEILNGPENITPSGKKNYTMGVSFIRNSRNHTLEIGCEIGKSNDAGNYLVNLGTYDSIGFYNYINGFTIDPQNPGHIIFDIQQIPVWDSVRHQSQYQTPHEYFYVNIPLLAGYKAWDQGFLTAYFKFGPVFSYLLKKHEPLPQVYIPGATIYGIDNQSLKRSKTTVQALFSVSLKMQATEKFGILVEPTYRRYLLDVYEVSDQKLPRPYGIGFRAGLFYTF